MGKTKGIISAEEWAKGISAQGDDEKRSAIIKVLEEGNGAAYSMEAIGRKSGLKWPYSTVQALVKAGKVERKKIGKAHYYKLKVAKVPR